MISFVQVARIGKVMSLMMSPRDVKGVGRLEAARRFLAARIGGEGLVFSMRNKKAVGMHADIIAALKLILEDNSLVHVVAESRARYVADEEDMDQLVVLSVHYS